MGEGERKGSKENEPTHFVPLRRPQAKIPICQLDSGIRVGNGTQRCSRMQISTNFFSHLEHCQRQNIFGAGTFPL